MFIRYFIACFCILSVLEGTIVVNSGAELQSGILALNSGSDTLIQFGSSFSYSQELFPFNVDSVLNSVDNTFTIDGQGNTLTQQGERPAYRAFFARESIGTVTIENLTINGAHAKGGDGALLLAED